MGFPKILMIWGFVRPQTAEIQVYPSIMYVICIHGYDIHTIFSFILLIVSGGPNIHCLIMASKFHAARSSRLWLEACLSAWMRTLQAVLVSEGRPFKGSFGDPNSWQMNNLHEGNWLLRLVRLAPKLFGDFTLEQGVNSYYCGWARCARLVCTFSYCNLWIPTILPHFEILRPLTLRDSIFPIHKGILLWSHIFLNVGEL